MSSLTEHETKQLLQQYNIPVARGKEATSEKEAVSVAQKCGFPVMLKASSSKIQHKSDINALAEARTKDEVSQYYHAIIRNAKTVTHDIAGVLVEKKTEGVKLIIGVNNDPQFGHMLMFGLGGIYVELIEDVHFRHIPLRQYDAWDLLRDMQSAAVLEGFRQFKPVNKKTLVSILVKVSELIEDQPQIDSLDLNPVIADGNNVVVADAALSYRHNAS